MLNDNKLRLPAHLANQSRKTSHVRFIQIHHYHTDNSHHLAQFRLRRAPGDLPASLREATAHARREAVRQAIGDVPPDVEGAFLRLAGSMIHDLYGLRHMAGPPARVLNTEIWNDVTVTDPVNRPHSKRLMLEPDDVVRAVMFALTQPDTVNIDELRLSHS